MHIKEIEIDGFKSYAQKQIIGKFDDQFNAITGLNGSGKSNILDSICFVLGISNLTHIRATSNNDLIFKSGQCGITKAFVKITFDNTGARRFSNYGDVVTITRTISISSGTTKGSNNYTICGSNASCSAVADLFRSVGLNVNNPHFLIMQGRITKVLNMKPVEILGMIEEAAGTKMYDQKRNTAIQNMEKKDQKIEDIKQLMEQEILPTVQRMKDDREEYLKYQKYERDIQLCRRKHSAYIFDRALKQCRLCTDQIEEKEKEKEEVRESITNIGKEIEEVEVKMKEQDKEKGAAFKKQREEVDKNIAKMRSDYLVLDKAHEDLKCSVGDMDNKLTRAEGTKASDVKALAKLETDLQKKEGELGGEEQRGTEMEEGIKAAKAKLIALEQGMTTNDAGEMVTLESQITEARTRLTEMTTECKTREVRANELKRKKMEKEKELERYEKEDKEFTQFRGKTEKEMSSIKADMDKMRFDETEYMEKRAELDKMTQEMRDIDTVRRQIEDVMISKEAQFRDVPGISREKDVLGMLPRFFKLKDVENRFAIEYLLGNHFGLTVVRSGDVASRLMDQRAFTKRTTCIPMDGKDEEDSRDQKAGLAKRLEIARSLAPRGEKVDYAIDLIEFDPKLSYVAKFMLSGVLVCDTKETAALICFHKDINTRTLTRDGLVDVKPAGVVGGGARAVYQGGIDLRETNRWHEMKEKLAEMAPRFKEIEKSLAEGERTAAKFNQMKERYDGLHEQLEAMKEKFKFSAAATLRADLDAIEEELPQLNEYVKESAVEMKGLKEKIAQFEERKKNEKAFADKEKADCKKRLKTLEDEQKKAKGGFEKAKTTLSAMRSEIASLSQSIKEGEEAIVKYKNELSELRMKMDKAEKATVEGNNGIDAATAERDKLYAEIKGHEEEMNQLRKTIEKDRKEIAQKEAKLEELEREKVKLGEDVESWKKEAKAERKNNPWIEDEKEHFGQKGTDYDFTGYSAATGKKKIEDMEAEMKKMNSHINVNTMNMLAPSEERVLALQKKQQQIEKDKMKLLETIQKLDEKKKIELLAAYKSVNKDFNGIFSTLLPGTSAKLEPADGKDPLRGIEIKVAFNNKWKDSLGELSGGQRSLVALSLVLAMLKFRPAPLYILDEVDAALDLSHTQNIGAMIKTHFKESQFIIVSLKEGMFNHANILFRTRFVDGTSQVSRIDNTAANKS
ncbi:hypothetical protein PFISCL1PPCAC_5978 [Pristionchus fissidentatus]|uniref:Structural maintenance of chromosomes protein n=1 Tax=Pristionchus fissidentatus TaxID=1538716 RepID=A0AAV5V5P5_9BILA|nr:hypothetical protein PFISCL1PPCAC_5978 [Pristionchus fissidentatus]